MRIRFLKPWAGPYEYYENAGSLDMSFKPGDELECETITEAVPPVVDGEVRGLHHKTPIFIAHNSTIQCDDGSLSPVPNDAFEIIEGVEDDAREK